MRTLARNELDKFVHCHRYLVNVESYLFQKFQNILVLQSFRKHHLHWAIKLIINATIQATSKCDKVVLQTMSSVLGRSVKSFQSKKIQWFIPRSKLEKSILKTFYFCIRKASKFKHGKEGKEMLSNTLRLNFCYF